MNDTRTPHTMQCLEVWGGTRAADNGVVMPGLDAWVFAQPFEGDDNGGDVHYLSSCATGRIVRLLLADVAGHGHDAAEVSERLRTVMRRYINYVDQGRLVAEINRAFGGVTEVGRFATAVVATCWTPRDEFTLTNAGHPRPLRYDARKNAWSVLEPVNKPRRFARRPAPTATDESEPRNIPLGIAAAEYDEHRVRLATGDLLMVYSDAMVEARAPGGDMLGERGLLDTLAALDPTDPKRLIADLRAAIRAHTQRDDSDDDVTVMILRTNTLKPRGSPLTGAKAAGRIAADLARSVTRRGRTFGMPQINLRNIGGAFVDKLNRSDDA